MSHVGIDYTGATPGTDSNDYVLFSSVTSFPMARAFAMMGIHKLEVRLINDHTGTLKCYFSNDRGTTWTRVYADISVGAAGTSDSNNYEFVVEGMKDFKVVWTNGGTAQGAFSPMLSLIESRNAVA